jgi:crotonobetainyl-CoA:carnitine CoA-transferase CaiB-like acyl-CoA transferase
LLASVVGVHAYQGTRWTVAHEVPQALGNHHPSIAPYGLFHTADAPIQIACGNDNQWRVLAAALGVDDPRFSSNRARVGLREDLVEVMEAALGADTAAVWLDRLALLGIPAGKVRTLDDVYAWEQTLSQGLLIDVDHPTAGPIQLPGPALRFDDNDYAGARTEHLHPPLLGEHNESVRVWLDDGDGSTARTAPR